MSTPIGRRNPLGPVILRLLDGGLTQGQVGQKLGISKNVVSGIWARAGRGTPRGNPHTMLDRLDAMHAVLDRVIAENVGIGRIPDPEQEPRK